MYESIRLVCQKFTTAEPKYAGSIKYYPKLIRSIVGQNPFNDELIKELTKILNRLSLVQAKPRVSFGKDFWQS